MGILVACPSNQYIYGFWRIFFLLNVKNIPYNPEVTGIATKALKVVAHGQENGTMATRQHYEYAKCRWNGGVGIIHWNGMTMSVSLPGVRIPTHSPAMHMQVIRVPSAPSCPTFGCAICSHSSRRAVPTIILFGPTFRPRHAWPSPWICLDGLVLSGGLGGNLWLNWCV